LEARRAILHGGVHVTIEDIRAIALPVLRHRIVTTFNADAEGVTTDDIVRKLLAAIPCAARAGRRSCTGKVKGERGVSTPR
jgi:MoxR-like ATPase